MTLQELFDLLSSNPEIIIFYFAAIPLTAFLASVFGRGEGHLTPWKQLYCVLVYLSTIPGIFAVLLNIYLFLFERSSIMQTNLYTQVLPIIAMILTLWLIRRNVPFGLIPGFDRISGLTMITFSILGLFWVLDRTHIIAFSYLPFHIVIIILLLSFVVVRIGINKIMRSGTSSEE